MNALQRSWRRQQAIGRARNIRRYRKGHPKLGCYKCWYDCYEVESDRCPECNAEIERGLPWWRDGKWNLLTLLSVQGGVLLAFAAAFYVSRGHQKNAGLEVLAATLAAGIVGYFSLFGFPLLAIKRTRSERAQTRRFMTSMVLTVLGMTLIIQAVDSLTN